MKTAAEPSRTGGMLDGMAGAYAAMITPFTRDDRVNEGAIEQLIEYGLNGGLAGFYLTGSTGEWLPIYIDKPLAMTILEAERIYALEKRPGQIFTCSALAYSDGLRTGDIGDIRHIQAFGTKGAADVDFGDTFFMFRNALRTFVEIVRGERENESRAITMKVMDILERGNQG